MTREQKLLKTKTVEAILPPSKQIFITMIMRTDGTKTHVISSQSISDNSIHVTRSYVDEIWEGKKYVTKHCNNEGALFLLMALYLCNDHQHSALRLLCADVWKEILGFTFGFSQHDSDPLTSIGHYAIAIRKTPSIFQKNKIDPSIIVHAAMYGDEDMVINILDADPRILLESAEVENFLGIKSSRTPLQAAIAANDIQLIEKMQKYFHRLSMGDVCKQQQILQIYTESLQVYLKKLKNLEDRKLYQNLLEKGSIRAIFKAHQQIQVKNAFDFQPYVSAILNATLEELQEAIALIGAEFCETEMARVKPFEQLTLIEKLNRFRENFVKHTSEEIIFNTQHILSAVKCNDEILNHIGKHPVPHDYKVLQVIFSQLIGFAQRCAPEPIKQDIRQGISYLMKKNESHHRPYGVGDDIVDSTILDCFSIDGLGYQFGVAEKLRPTNWMLANRYWLSTMIKEFCLDARGDIYLGYVTQKNIKLSELILPTPLQLNKHHADRQCSVM